MVFDRGILRLKPKNFGEGEQGHNFGYLEANKENDDEESV